METTHYDKLLKLYKLALLNNLQENDIKRVISEAVLEKDKIYIASNSTIEVDKYIDELNTLYDDYLTRRTSNN